MSKEFKSLELKDVDRLELSGIRRSDGVIEYGDYEFEDWPEKLDISTACGAYVLTYRLEETEDMLRNFVLTSLPSESIWQSTASCKPLPYLFLTPENEDDPVVCLAWYVLDV